MAQEPRRLHRLARVSVVVALVGAVAGLWPAAAQAQTSDLDPTFGNEGHVATSFGGDAIAVDIARLRSRILVVGSVRPSGGSDRIAVARYRENGRLDTSFGSGGKVTVGFAEGSVRAAALVAMGDGRFVVGGTLYPRGHERPSLMALVRFLHDGRLDTSFGHGGRVVVDPGPGSWELAALVRQVNGKLVAGGTHSSNSPPAGFALVRLAGDGSVDRSYGHDGHVVTVFPGPAGPEPLSNIQGMTVDVAGRVIAVGGTSPDFCGEKWALARYEPDGSLDPTFGGDGRVVTRFRHNLAVASAVAFGDDNRLTVVGSNTFLGCGGSPPPETGQAALARYLPNGRLDRTFGGDGKVATTFFGTQAADASYEDMTLEEGGQIAATGSAELPASGRNAVIVGLYLRNGDLNTAFSNDGKAFAAGPLEYSFGTALYEDIDGSPVVAGWTAPQSGSGRFLVERYKPSA